MFVTNSPNAIVHANADCNCASCLQLCKPGMNGLPPSMLSCQNTCFVEKINDVKTNGVTTEKYRDNVISITAAIKSARQVSKVTFNYPMLECS